MGRAFPSRQQLRPASIGASRVNATATNSTTSSTTDFRALLQQAGFTNFRGNNATCPYCEGRNPRSVSVGEDVAFCHRCYWTRNLRTLSRELALPVAAETTEQRKARWRARAFKEWLDICWAILSGRLRRLAGRAQWARVALGFCPDLEPAWDALAAFYHAEAELAGAFEVLTFEKVPTWVEQPITRQTLFTAFEEAVADGP